MRADSFRDLFDYHIDANRRLWESSVMTLTDGQFSQKLDYSVGSIRNQCVHLMTVDERWFCSLRRVEVPRMLNPVHYPRREKIRAYWDRVEGEMRAYLAYLDDDQLEDFLDDMPTWAVLQHIVLHGVDHRAQMLAALRMLGAPTYSQDFILRYWKR
ncbi:MAG: DinB family protein [Chloroflexi bacterium]|nr:DinB family protein [Chloroflexota bacterium]